MSRVQISISRQGFRILGFIPRILLYVHERQTNALILFKDCSLSYILLHISASSMPSSGSLHVPTELLVPSESLIKFYELNDYQQRVRRYE
jgi:hypothetical protein